VQTVFGAGVLWCTPTADSYGNAIAVPSPVQFGVCNEIGLDISADTKMLYGNQQMPVAIGRGKMKIGLKIKAAQVNGTTFNSFFFGQTLVSGVLANVWDRTGTAIPTTPYTITPTVPGAATWATDLGVVNTNGSPLTRVASAPATGQYTATAGVYGFAAADVGLVVYISYQYTATSAIAKKSSLVSLAMGATPTFRTDVLMTSANGKQMVWTFPNCVASKLSLATKLDDFTIPEIDADVFADSAGNIGSYGVSE
jgi:hypothetical protein